MNNCKKTRKRENHHDKQHDNNHTSSSSSSSSIPVSNTKKHKHHKKCHHKKSKHTVHTHKHLLDVDKDSSNIIMTFLDFQDLLSFTSTCQSLFQLSTLYPSLWHSFTIKLLNEHYNKFVAILFPTFIKRVKYISNFQLHDIQPASLSLFQYFPSITSLSLSILVVYFYQHNVIKY